MDTFYFDDVTVRMLYGETFFCVCYIFGVDFSALYGWFGWLSEFNIESQWLSLLHEKKRSGRSHPV